VISRKRRRRDNPIKSHTSYQILAATECYSKSVCTDCWSKIPDVQVVETNPRILDTFQSNLENPLVPCTAADLPSDHEEEEPWLHNGQIIADGTIRNRDRGQTADVKVISTFDGTPVPTLIDITVTSTSVVSYHAHAVKDKYSSGLTDHATYKKDLKSSYYLTEGNAIGFAFDSLGGLSESATRFIINHEGT
jgi:hypothetical protein